MANDIESNPVRSISDLKWIHPILTEARSKFLELPPERIPAWYSKPQSEES